MRGMRILAKTYAAAQFPAAMVSICADDLRASVAEWMPDRIQMVAGGESFPGVATQKTCQVGWLGPEYVIAHKAQGIVGIDPSHTAFQAMEVCKDFAAVASERDRSAVFAQTDRAAWAASVEVEHALDLPFVLLCRTSWDGINDPKSGANDRSFACAFPINRAARSELRWHVADYIAGAEPSCAA